MQGRFLRPYILGGNTIKNIIFAEYNISGLKCEIVGGTIYSAETI
jgi:hypothetical protein